MKKAIISIFVLGLIFAFTQCEETGEDNRTIITKKIQYDVPIINPDDSHDWWIKNIEGSDREELLNNIFGRVLSGDVQAYDYFNKPLSVRQVEGILTDTIIQTLQRTTAPYAEYDTMVINKIGPSSVSLIRFLEEWKYDEKTLQVDKKVYAISPVIMVNYDGENYPRPLFWVYTDESILKK